MGLTKSGYKCTTQHAIIGHFGGSDIAVCQKCDKETDCGDGEKDNNDE